MAGATAVPTLHLMAVRGQITSAVITENAATFEGVGTVNLGDQGNVENQSFRVVATEGAAGVGTFQLTLISLISLVLPVEHVLKGRIAIH